MTKVLETKNESWGFFGTTNVRYSYKQTQEKWDEAFKILVKLSGLSAEIVRRYLDSKAGRHLADACYESDITKVIKEWWNKNWIQKEIFLKDYQKPDEEFYN